MCHVTLNMTYLLIKKIWVIRVSYSLQNFMYLLKFRKYTTLVRAVIGTCA